jgi:hypothetical protein
LNVRANTLILDDGSDKQFDRKLKTPAIGVSAEALYFPLKFLGAGLFFSRSITNAKIEYDQGITSSILETTTSSHTMYGLSIQGTTNRARVIRGFGVARIGKIEMVEEFDDFSIGDSGLFYSVGAGLTVSVTRNISINVIEANYCFLPKKLSLENTATMNGLQLQAGVQLKIWRIK